MQYRLRLQLSLLLTKGPVLGLPKITVTRRKVHLSISTKKMQTPKNCTSQTIWDIDAVDPVRTFQEPDQLRTCFFSQTHGCASLNDPPETCLLRQVRQVRSGECQDALRMLKQRHPCLSKVVRDCGWEDQLVQLYWWSSGQWWSMTNPKYFEIIQMRLEFRLKQDAAHEPECSHVERFCETSYLNSLVHFPQVTAPVHCRLWNAEGGGVQSVE